jgi:hypothetical protein
MLNWKDIAIAGVLSLAIIYNSCKKSSKTESNRNDSKRYSLAKTTVYKESFSVRNSKLNKPVLPY